MVSPDKGIALQQQVAHIKRKYGVNVKKGKVLSLNKKLLRLKAAAGEHPRQEWWQALPPAKPEKEKTAEEIKQSKVTDQQEKSKDRDNKNHWTQANTNLSQDDKKVSSTGYNMLKIFLFVTALAIAYSFLKN